MLPQPINKRICSSCVDEPYLKRQISRKGKMGHCSYCKSRRRLRCFTIGQMASYVETAFDQHFYQTPDDDDGMTPPGEEWYRNGAPVTDVIANCAEISDAAAEDIQSFLEQVHYDRHKVRVMEECPFSGSSYYEEKPVDDTYYRHKWMAFERSLRTETRFFSETAASCLKEVFHQIDGMVSRAGSPLVIEAGPNRNLSALYRARVFQSVDVLKKALERPDKELAAPPAKYASAGRMNAHGISVFYGADNPDVCIAEVRPPVGSFVAVGRFRLLRDLRLMDLTALRSIGGSGGSVFDPEWANQLARMSFLSTLCDRMTQPVIPSDEAWEYLPTQAVADYLATKIKPRFDGLAFPSVQAGNEHMNVVLFQNSSRVKLLDIPNGTTFDVSTGLPGEFGWEHWYHVSENRPQEALDTETSFSHTMFLTRSHSIENVDDREETLEIDNDGVHVHHIQQVNYCSEAHKVSRSTR